MTTATTSAVIAQASDANFNTWVQEIYTNLVTNCGLSQLSATMDTGQLAVPAAFAGTLTANTAAGYYMFAFNDALAAGALNNAALATLAGGTGYDGGGSGTFTGVALTGGSGSSATATVVVASGVITSITPTLAALGTGYKIGDNLTITSANMVAAGASSGGSGGGAWVQKLSTGSPVVIKLEFGAAAATTTPQMWITVSQSWTSSGTLATGTTRVAVCNASAPTSTTTAYTSYYCYNATYGFLGLVFKIGSGGTSVTALGGIILFRSSNSSGVATGTSISLITNSTTATGTTGATSGNMQTLQFSNNTVYPTLNTSNSPYWGTWVSSGTTVGPFGLTTTLESSTVFVFPVLYMNPAIAYGAYCGAALTGDIPVGTSFSAAIVGSTSLTFISVGLAFGSGGLGGGQNYNGSSGSVLLVMLWQ